MKKLTTLILIIFVSILTIQLWGQDMDNNKKVDKEEVLEVIVSFKDYTPFALQDQMEDGELLFSHALEYFVESPKEFYGKRLEIFTDTEISKKNVLRKEDTKITFKIQRKYIVKTYQNKDGTANTYEAYLGEIYKNGEIKEASDMKEIYLTHETFDIIAKYAKSNGSSIGLGDGHFAFINNYEIKYYEKINRNNKEFSALLLQDEKTKQKLFIYKFYEKLKWRYECMVEKVVSDSLDEPQQHGFPNDFFDANEWFKEILQEIPQGDGFITKTESEKRAKEFLKKQKYADKYKIDTAKAIDNGKPYWNVWFETVERDIKPNQGLIEVDKKTGKAKWIYLK